MFGTLKGKIIIIDPDWWKPMTDDEVDDFLAGYPEAPKRRAAGKSARTTQS
jgi:hypothetical protein